MENAKPKAKQVLSSWTTVTPKVGDGITGRMIGESHCAWTHFRYGHQGKMCSMPCEAWASDGALGCDFKGCPHNQRFRAYVPVMTMAGERVVVICSETNFKKTLKETPVGTVLTFTRAKSECRPWNIRMRTADEGPNFKPTLISPANYQRVWGYLVHTLWASPHLAPFIPEDKNQKPCPLPDAGGQSTSVPPPPPEPEKSHAPRPAPKTPRQAAERPALPNPINLGEFADAFRTPD